MRSCGAEPDGGANDDSDAISGNGEVEDDTVLVVSGGDDEYSSDDDGAAAEEAEQLSSSGTEDEDGDEEKLKPVSPRARTDGASRSPLVAASPDAADGPLAPRSASGRDPRLTPLEIFCGCLMLTLRSRERTQAAAPPSVTTEAKTDAVEHIGGVGIAVTTTSSVVGAKAQTGDQGPSIISNNLLLGGEQGDGSAAKVPRKRRRSISKEDKEEARKKVRLVKATKEKRPYVCRRCGEEFPTHQALGGHMAGHHREKKVPVLDSKEDAASLSVADHPQGMAVGQSHRQGKPAKRGGVEQEQVPMAPSNTGVLPPGQAPSGGERSKLQVVRRCNTGSPLVEVPAAAADSNLRPPPLDIDLNIHAPEQG